MAHGIQPSDTRYTCMLDHLACAVWWREAEVLVEIDPMRLSLAQTQGLPCWVHVSKHSTPGDSTNSVLLSNVYVHCKRWKTGG